MKTDQIKKMLIYEVENKKTHEAYSDTMCNQCGSAIAQGDTFIFMADKQKVCTNCQGDIMSFLEE